MLIKFESKSNRVKGLAFHPKRPWILASLHNGTIQLWDWRMEVLIEKYEGHDGPVRGIDFHPTQPLFVSSGDDYVIRVWNYTQRRCLFTLSGHLDYIRTVQFHHEYPWILSASDDQTVRIWNWQSRQCLSVLTGHNHYVMCAQFHPKEDLIVSASLDQTVRIWDFSGLRKKTVSIRAGAGEYPSPMGSPGMSMGPGAGPSGGDGGGDLFGLTDVSVRHVLEGHTRGVNWASFHRSLNLVVSGADDREVKLWRITESKAWEVDTLRGHLNNVSCVMFHPKRELIISNSEDKTIRVWDMNKVANPLILRREHDRYWILDAHPTLNLLAAGHDSGLMVFKLHRERPPMDASNTKNVYYFKDLYVYEYNIKSGKEKPILSTRRRGQSGGSTTGNSGAGAATSYRNLHYNTSNQAQHCILLTSDADGSYELYTFAKSKDESSMPSAAARGGRFGAPGASMDEMGMGMGGGGGVGMEESHQALRGYGKCAVFVSRTRFAVLDKSRQLFIKTLKNETKRKISIPNVSINYIFPGGVGRLLLRTSEAMYLYDIQSLKILAEMHTQIRHPIKYVVWSSDHAHCALFSKTTIYLTNGMLGQSASLNEQSRIKSGAWDPAGVFVYTTSTHIKYMLPNGDSGILRTLDAPIYLTSASSASSTVTYIDREGKPGKLSSVDATEYLFKLALLRHKNREVLRLMQTKKLVGESIIAYLHKKGYPEVALHFVTDPEMKFALALECGNIGVALECATKLDKDECWHRLGVEALRQGNHQVVEAAYQRTKNFERLSFLYLITGNIDKLSKMLHIATLRGDIQGRFHNALYLGNVGERIRVLREAGHLPLALFTARSHHMEEEAEAIIEEMGGPDALPPSLLNLLSKSQDEESGQLLPPTPILREANWPLLEVRKGFFDQVEAPDEDVQQKVGSDAAAAAYESSGEEEEDEEGEGGEVSLGWGDGADLDIDIGADGKKKKSKKGAKAAAEAAAEETKAVEAGGGWGGDLDIDLPGGDADLALGDAGEAGAEGAGTGGEDYFVMPLPGKSAASKWASSSALAADQVAAGAFDQAMHLLNRQIGVVNFQPLKQAFLAIHNAAHATLPPLLPHTPPISTPLFRPLPDGKDSELPCLAYKLGQVVDPLKSAYKNVTEGKFSAALKEFVSVLHTLPLVVVEKRAEVAEVGELLSICREYITALRLELMRKDAESSGDLIRAVSLAAYFTMCKLQTTHLILGLKSAIKSSYTSKNFALTATFCRRLLEIVSSSNSPTILGMVNMKQIKGVLAVCEKNGKDEKPIDFPESNFNLDCLTGKPIPRGATIVHCPYCQSTFGEEAMDQVCPNCLLSRIGMQTTGLRVFLE